MVQLFRRGAEQDVVPQRVRLGNDIHQHIQIALPRRRKRGSSRLFSVASAEDAQTGHAGPLSEGHGHIRKAQVPGGEAFRPNDEVVGKVRGGSGLVLDGEPVPSVEAPLQLPLGHPIGFVDVPGLGAGADGAGTGNVDPVVGEVHLHGTDVHGSAQVHLQPFAAVNGSRLPPGLHVLLRDFSGFVTGRAGGRRGRLARAQQHPGWVPPGIVLLPGDRHGPVAVALVAKELPVRVEACGPEAHPALKIMIFGDAHGGRVPQVPLPVRHGGAVARAGQKAAGLVGIGIVSGQGEGPQRMVAHVHSVGVGVVLSAGRGVLKIVFPVMLVHPGPLDIGPVGEHAADQRLHVRRDHGFRHALGFHERLIFCLYLRVGSGQGAVVFAHALEADSKGAALYERGLFSLGKHSFRIQLHAIDGRLVGAAPVEIDPAVVVPEQIGVPEGEGALDPLIGPVQDVLRAPAVAGVLPVGGAEIHPVPQHPHVRRVVVEGQLVRETMAFPMHQIVADPNAQRHGSEDIISPLKLNQRRIRRLPADLQRTAPAGIGVELIPVGDVQRVTVILHSDRFLSPLHGQCRRAGGSRPGRGR